MFGRASKKSGSTIIRARIKSSYVSRATKPDVALPSAHNSNGDE